MNLNKKVLVLISIYNEPLEFVMESIKSIRDQSYNNLKVTIIIDNPNLKNDVDEYLNNVIEIDKRFSIHHNERNIGLANSLNLAFELSNINDVEYVARMDADDISSKERFKTQIEYLDKNKDIDLLGSSAYKIDENGKNIGRFSISSGPVYLNYGSNSIHPTWIMKKNVFISLNGYRNFECAQDYDFLCRAKLNGYNIHNLSTCLLYYRLNSGSIGSRKRLRQRQIKYFISKKFRDKKLLDCNLPDYKDNFMSMIFNYIEAKKNNKLYVYLLYPFSFYHVRNIYLLHMKRFGF